MKQKDIALIVVVAVISLVLATVLSNLLFGGASGNRNLEAESIQPITGTFEQPNTNYFNTQSIDPTETIQIQTNTNQTPFNQTQQ